MLAKEIDIKRKLERVHYKQMAEIQEQLTNIIEKKPLDIQSLKKLKRQVQVFKNDDSQWKENQNLELLLPSQNQQFEAEQDHLKVNSIMASPVASSNASLNQAFAINPDDLVSESEAPKSSSDQEIKKSLEQSPEERAKKQKDILNSLAHDKRSNSASTTQRRLLSEVEHSDLLSLSQRERLVYRLMNHELSRNSLQTPDSLRQHVGFEEVMCAEDSRELTPINRKRIFRGLKEFHREIQKMSQEEFEACLKRLKQNSKRSKSVSGSSCLHDSRNQQELTIPSLLHSLNNNEEIKELDEEKNLQAKSRGKSARSAGQSGRGKYQPKQKLGQTQTRSYSSHKEYARSQSLNKSAMDPPKGPMQFNFSFDKKEDLQRSIKLKFEKGEAKHMRSPNQFSKLGIESQISAIEACSHSMSIEAGSELGKLIANTNTVGDKSRKEILGEMVLSELKEEEFKDERKGSSQTDKSQVVKIVQSNKVICIPFLNLKSIKGQKESPQDDKKLPHIIGEITPGSFEVADCSAILPNEEDNFNSSKIGNLSFALDTPIQKSQDEMNVKKPPVMIFDEYQSKTSEDEKSSKDLERGIQMKGERMVQDSLLISPIPCREEEFGKISKDSSMEMPSFLKDSGPDLLITYEEATIPLKFEENPKTQKKAKKSKEKVNPEKQSKKGKRKEERGRKKKKTPDPGHSYAIKEKRSRSSSSDRVNDSEAKNHLMIVGQSIDSGKKFLQDIPSVISLKQIQAQNLEEMSPSPALMSSSKKAKQTPQDDKANNLAQLSPSVLGTLFDSPNLFSIQNQQNHPQFNNRVSKFIIQQNKSLDNETRLPTAYFPKQEETKKHTKNAMSDPKHNEELRTMSKISRKSVRIHSSRKSSLGKGIKISSAPPKRNCQINIEDSSKFISIHDENMLLQPPPPPLSLKSRRFKRPLMARNVFKEGGRPHLGSVTLATSEPASMILSKQPLQQRMSLQARGQPGILHPRPIARKLSPPKISRSHPFQKNHLLDSPHASEPSRLPKFYSHNSSMQYSFELTPQRKVSRDGHHSYNPFMNDRQSHSFSFNTQAPPLPSRIKRVHSFSGDLDHLSRPRLQKRISLNQSIISNRSLQIPDPIPPARLQSATNVSSQILPPSSSSTLFPSYPSHSNNSHSNLGEANPTDYIQKGVLMDNISSSLRTPQNDLGYLRQFQPREPVFKNQHLPQMQSLANPSLSIERAKMRARQSQFQKGNASIPSSQIFTQSQTSDTNGFFSKYPQQISPSLLPSRESGGTNDLYNFKDRAESKGVSDNISEQEVRQQSQFKLPVNYQLHTPPINSGWCRVSSAPFTKNSPSVFSSVFSTKGVSPTAESMAGPSHKPVKGVIGVFIPKHGSKKNLTRPFPKNLSLSVRSKNRSKDHSLLHQDKHLSTQMANDDLSSISLVPDIDYSEKQSSSRKGSLRSVNKPGFAKIAELRSSKTRLVFGGQNNSRASTGDKLQNEKASSLMNSATKQRPSNPEPLSFKFVKPLPNKSAMGRIEGKRAMHSGVSEDSKSISLTSNDIDLKGSNLAVEGEGVQQHPTKTHPKFLRKAIHFEKA